MFSTDHKPLTHALRATPNHYSPREIRHLDFISQFTSDIRHVKGEANVVTDALSRIDINALTSSSFRGSLPVDFEAVARQQRDCEELTAMTSNPESTSLKLESVPIADSSETIICDTSSGRLRPFIPHEYRRAVFDAVHALAHPGTRATQRLLGVRFVLARYEQRCTHMGSIMHTMPTFKSSSSYREPNRHFRRTRCPLQSCPHRPRRAPPTVRRFFVPLHVCGPLH